MKVEVEVGVEFAVGNLVVVYSSQVAVAVVVIRGCVGLSELPQQKAQAPGADGSRWQSLARSALEVRPRIRRGATASGVQSLLSNLSAEDKKGVLSTTRRKAVVVWRKSQVRGVTAQWVVMGRCARVVGGGQRVVDEAQRERPLLLSY